MLYQTLYSVVYACAVRTYAVTRNKKSLDAHILHTKTHIYVYDCVQCNLLLILNR